MVDDSEKDPKLVSQQIPHTRTAKGGFAKGRRVQHVRSEIHRSVREYPDRPPENLDNADREIEAATREGRQISLERAFPQAAEHPRRKHNSSGDDAARLHPGANSNEPEPNVTVLDDPISPEGRLPHIKHRHSTYATEYRLTLVHRLTLRGLPLARIGAMLGITTRQVQTLRAELTQRIKKEAEHADIPSIVGETRAFYNEIRSMCMQVASESADVNTRLAALEKALAAEADWHRFLQSSGFYDVAKFIPKPTPENDKAAELTAALQSVTIDQLNLEDDDEAGSDEQIRVH